ncbi:MAG: ompW family protein [Massilia sp.]|jgi:outer membrane protein|nr:ompW family protein [Massilia sp.]
MKASLKNTVTLLAAACAMAVAGSASAQSAGQFTAKIGAGKITPKVDSGDISAPALPGSKVAVGSDTEPVFIFAYGITDNISAELDLGLPYKHKLYGAGAIEGTGQLGTVEALPPVAFIQYRFFRPDSVVRPFVGLGLGYTYFQKERGSGQLTALMNPGGQPTTFSAESKVTPSVQAGVAVNLSAKWFVDLTVVKTKLTSTTTYSTGQTQTVKLDPFSVIVAVGYKF